MDASIDDLAFARFQRSGDPGELARVYDALAPGLLRLALRLTGDPATAEDVLQSTFLAAIESADRYDTGRPVRRWLAGILVNQVRTHRRKVGRTPDPHRLGPLFVDPDRRAGPDQDAVDAEVADSVGREVRRLPAAWQDPILLRVRDGLSAPEIARALGRPAGTVRSQLARGLERLRRGLGPALTGGWFGGLFGRRPRATRSRSGAATPVGVATAGGLGVPVLVLVTVLVVLGSAVLWTQDPDPVGVDPVTVGTARGVVVPRPVAASTSVSLPSPPPAAVAALTPARSEPAATIAPDAVDEEAVAERHTLRFRIVDGADEPVPGAILEAWASMKEAQSQEPPSATWHADEEGALTLDLAADVTVAARHDEVGRSRLHTVSRLAANQRAIGGEGRAARDHVLALRPPVQVIGRVVDPDGRPVPRAAVRISHGGGQVLEGRVRKTEELSASREGTFEVQVDPFATWSFSSLVDGRRSVSVSVDGRPGDEVTIELTAPGPWSVSGQVLDPTTQQPLPDATVHLWVRRDIEAARGGTSLGGLDRQVRADEEGRYAFDIPRLGAWQLGATAAGRAPADFVQVEVTEQHPTPRVNLVLAPRRPVTGRVVDALGEPVADVRVSARPEGHSPFNRGSGPGLIERWGEASATTDAAGAFTLVGLHPRGTFDLRVTPDPERHRHYATYPGIPGGSEELRLLLDEASLARGFVTGRVVEAGTGRPVTFYELQVVWHVSENSRTGSDRIVEDAEGRFRIDDLLPGERYSLVASPLKEIVEESLGDFSMPLPIPSEDLAEAEAPSFVADVAGHHVELEVPGWVALTARLLDERGDPIPFVPVHADRAGRTARVGGIMSYHPQRTDEAGAARFARLPPGEWSLRAEVGGVTISDVVGLEPGERTVVLRP